VFRRIFEPESGEATQKPKCRCEIILKYIEKMVKNAQ
jgi:hypothetical protein